MTPLSTGPATFSWQCNGRHRQLRPIARPHDWTRPTCLHGSSKGGDRAQYPPVCQRQPGQQRALVGRPRHRQSTLIKAVFNGFREQGVRLLEVDREHLVELPRIIDQLHARPERFILFCDDLSFEADDSRYKSLKAVLDGSVAAPPPGDTDLRDLQPPPPAPEAQADNQAVTYQDGELHPGDTHRGKDIAVRTLWPVVVVLPFHPGSVPGRSSTTGCNASPCRHSRQTRSCARPRCAGPATADHAAAGWRASSWWTNWADSSHKKTPCLCRASPSSFGLVFMSTCLEVWWSIQNDSIFEKSLLINRV